MVHLAGLDMQPEVKRRENADPRVDDQIDDVPGVTCCDPAFPERNDRGPVAQGKVVYLKGAAARRQKAAHCEHCRRLATVVGPDEKCCGGRQVDARRQQLPKVGDFDELNMHPASPTPNPDSSYAYPFLSATTV